MRSETRKTQSRTPPKTSLGNTAIVCFILAVLAGVAHDEAKVLVKDVLTSATTFVADVWVWPSDYVTHRRLESIANYRARAATELWTARNMTFETSVTEELRAALRERYIWHSVMLELQARQLEHGDLVRKSLSPTWYENDNFSIYPTDLALPLDFEYPKSR